MYDIDVAPLLDLSPSGCSNTTDLASLLLECKRKWFFKDKEGEMESTYKMPFFKKNIFPRPWHTDKPPQFSINHYFLEGKPSSKTTLTTHNRRSRSSSYLQVFIRHLSSSHQDVRVIFLLFWYRSRRTFNQGPGPCVRPRTPVWVPPQGTFGQ